MTLPLVAGACSRCAPRLAAALLVLLAVVPLAGPASRAQEADAFAATVKVDASAETITRAREMARIDGQRRAFTAVAERQSAGGTPVKVPKLDDKALTELVSSFEVANERMSTVRYVADYTFHFRPAEVKRLLGAAAGNPATGASASTPASTATPSTTGFAPSAASGKPTVVIPVLQAGAQTRLWEDPNPWRDSWERRSAGTGAARIIVPLGDASDLAAIDAVKARGGDAEAIAAVARNNGADDAVVAVAAPRGSPSRPSGLDVTLKRYRAGRLLDSRSESVAANPGEGVEDLFGRAVAAITANLGGGGTTDTAAPAGGPEGSLTAVLPIASLEDWLSARERLGAVPAIRKVGLVALSRQEATIEIGYVGGIDQLKAGLADISLDLVRGEPLWRLSLAGSRRAPRAP